MVQAHPALLFRGSPISAVSLAHYLAYKSIIANSPEDECTYSNRDLCKILDCSPPTIVSNRLKLESAGFITCEDYVDKSKKPRIRLKLGEGEKRLEAVSIKELLSKETSSDPQATEQAAV